MGGEKHMNNNNGLNPERIKKTIEGLEELKTVPNIYLPLVNHYEGRLRNDIGNLRNVLDQADQYIEETKQQLRMKP